MRIIIPIFCLLLLFSCSEKAHNSSSSNQNKELTNINLKYAKGFKIEKTDSTTFITIVNPKSGEIVQKLVISDNPINMNNTIWVKLHPTSLFSSSVTHIAFLDVLHKLSFLKGFSQTNYIYNSEVRNALNEGRVEEVGTEEGLNIEKIITLHPDVFFISGLLGKTPQFDKVSQSGIPVVEVIEWVEVHPLARAEWIKFFGVFYNEEKLADSIFNDIEKKYLDTKKITEEVKERPLIMSGKSFKGTWWMPGGRNYSSILTNDAGGYYPYYTTDTNTNSLPLSLEKVVVDFLHADYWISPGANSLQQLINEESRYADFTPVKTENVYEPNKRSFEFGANDFWETAMLRPDILLKDLVKIFHPELLPQHQLYFYQKLD